MSIRDTIVEPYWVTPIGEAMPGYDFNRELVAPGTNEDLPEGAVVIRTDCDFWTVAVLP